MDVPEVSYAPTLLDAQSSGYLEVEGCPSIRDSLLPEVDSMPGSFNAANATIKRKAPTDDHNQSLQQRL